jgi:nucleotide-binding universal stress UspA family protein
MYTNIAVATDGSPVAEKAVQTAIDLAATFGSELTILHVLMHGEPPEALKRMVEVEHLVPDEPLNKMPLSTTPGPMMNIREEVERHRLDHKIYAALGDEVIKQAKKAAQNSGITSVKGAVLEGDATDQIITAAKKNDVDLIVLGARGLGPLKGLLMGSVSQKVSQMADCACLTVK